MKRVAWIGACALSTSVFLACPSEYAPVSNGDPNGIDATTIIVVPPTVKDANGILTSTDGGALCDVDKPFSAPVEVSALDTSGQDFSLRLSSDYLTGYFASIRDTDGGIYGLWSTTRATPFDTFGNIAMLSSLYAGTAISGPSVTGDGLTIYFTQANGSEGGDDIYFATRTSLTASFGKPAIVPNVSSPKTDHAPFIREDGQVLYFSSTSSGAFEIYDSTLGKSGFSAPTSIAELNIVGNNDAPIVTPDGLVIYYGSDRTDDGALGSYDVWVSTRATTDVPFGGTKDVIELNSPAGERPDFITRDRCTLYLHRDVLDDAGTVTARILYMATKQP